MPQFRLTTKFANDYGAKSLSEPHHQLSVLDDWVIDVLSIQRRKVAVAIHAKSLLVFFIPYKDVGGAKNILEAVTRMLYRYLYTNGYYDDRIKINYENFLNSPVTLCKTDNRKILGHLNDFKRCLSAHVDAKQFDEIRWDDLMNFFQQMPVNVTRPNSSFPEKMFRELIEQDPTLYLH